jgi:hypothetical protein
VVVFDVLLPTMATMMAFWFIALIEYWKTSPLRSKAASACPTGVARYAARSLAARARVR